MNSLQAGLDTAADALASTLVNIFFRETERLRSEAIAREEERVLAEEEERIRNEELARQAEAAPPPSSRPRPLLSRPNVHVVPSSPPKPIPVRPVESPVPSGPSPEEMAEKAERFVLSSSLPPTFERIRRALRVSKAALAPVVEQLVANNKICVTDVGGVILYKPPRIEPIRRRRGERKSVAQHAG